jgi:uncharacterized protein YbjQ (UPF0145 family)
VTNAKFVDFIGAAFACLVAGCAPSSHILVGTPRPAISSAEVKIYTAPPAQFQEIALLDAHSRSLYQAGGQKSTDKVVERLKDQAAQLGANGIILGEVADHQTGAIGTGVGSDSYSHNSAVGVGFGGSLGIYKKTGKATAIYVPPAGPQ